MLTLTRDYISNDHSMDNHSTNDNKVSNLTLILIVVLIVFWFLVIIFGTLCSLSGESNSNECISGEFVNAIYMRFLIPSF